VDLASADSGELTPGTSVTVRPAERPVLVVPAEPQEGTEPRALE
jgi:putative spermidine/putrescine transport system ATP-binding protein